ncbi:MAG: AMP-binding protein [Thermaurantimonas sp.]
MSNFLIDIREDKLIEWKDLIEDLNKLNHINKVISSFSFYELFMLQIASVLNESDVILIDPELKDSEKLNLLGEKDINSLNEKIDRKYIDVKDKSDLVSRLLQASEASFTLFTSGTTGKPKAVRQSIRNLKKGLVVKDDKKNDIWGYCFHPTHIAGLQVFFQAVMNGNVIVRLFGLNVWEIEEAIKRCNITHLSATPTFYRLFLNSSKKFESVKRVTSGGEKLDNVLLERLKANFPNAQFRNIYASTEFGTLLVSKGEGFEIPNSLKDKVKIINNELCVHQSLLGSFVGQGQEVDEWYMTGDLIEIINENPNLLRFAGRKSDMINVGGMKVNINEVEETIRKVFEVQYVKVYSKNNSVLGNILCCDIGSNNPDLDETTIRRKLANHLQEFKIPRLIRFTNEFHLTKSLKTDRKQLKN